MFERGDLLLVPFPFTDLSAVKRRPVLALTEPDAYADFIALPVTSRPQPVHGLPLAADDLVSGTLPAASWIRTDRVVTLNVSPVIKRFGRVPNRMLATAVDRVCAYLTPPSAGEADAQTQGPKL